MTNHDRMAALLASAAHLGADYKTRLDAQSADMRKRADAATHAAARVEDDKFETGGFNALRYKGLTELAGALHAAFNTDSQMRRDAARGMADAFMSSMTGATAKSLAGGKQAGYSRVIQMGDAAERARVALQSRLDYWRGVKASAAEIEDAKEKAAAIATANRYLVPCGDAPMADGSYPTDKDGKQRVPKFCGRPAVVVNGVDIPYGRGTDRDAQFAAFAGLYESHGDKVFGADVVDAFLDNGGRFKPSGDKSVGDLANDALAAVDALLAAGGAQSGDGAFLQLAGAIFTRIAKEGLKGSAMPAEPDSSEAEESAPDTVAGSENPEHTENAPDAGTAEDILADAATEGVGVVLGAPAATPARPRRNRKQKEAEAA